MGKFPVIKITQYRRGSCLLHGEVMVGVLPELLLCCMATGTDLPADEVRTSRRISGSGWPGNEQ
jgi:hypothetical protein